MKSRGLRFTVGDIGEQLAITYFNTTSGLPTLIDAPKGAKNVDSLSRDGDRYSIKTLKSAKKTGTIYPDRSNEEKQLFEYLLLVFLTESYELAAIYRYSWQQFVTLRAWDRRMSAWYLPVSEKRLNAAERIYSAEET